MLSVLQIERLFYHTLNTTRTSESSKRLAREDWRNLWLWRYVARTINVGGVRVYWLTTKGATEVARYLGRPLKGVGRLEWVRRPIWGFLTHDLSSLDVMLDLVESVKERPDFNFLRLTPELHLRSKHTRVSYIDLNGKWRERSYIPDGILEFGNQSKNTFVYSFEYDRKTENPLRVASEKFLPFIKFIKSPEYKVTYGVDMGRMLVVTTDTHHLFSLKRAAEKALGSQARWILLTTRDSLSHKSGMMSPIWYQGKQSDNKQVAALG